MKGRSLFFLIGLLFGLLLGFGAGRETVRKKAGEILLQIARRVDEGIHQLLVKIRNTSDKNTEPAVREEKSGASFEEANSNSPISNAAYIREFVAIQEVTAKIGDTSKSVALVSGKVKNSGPRTPSRVEATIFFMGSDTIVFEASAPIVQQAPLAPGSTRDFSVSVQNVPTNWVVGRVRVAVTDIAF